MRRESRFTGVKTGTDYSVFVVLREVGLADCCKGKQAGFIKENLLTLIFFQIWARLEVGIHNVEAN